MENIIVVFPSRPSVEAIDSQLEQAALARDFRVEQSTWKPPTGGPHWIAQRGDAAAYLDLYRDFDDYPEDDLEQLEQLLGAKPASSVSIHIGHGRGSRALVDEIATTLITAFAGVLDPEP